MSLEEYFEQLNLYTTLNVKDIEEWLNVVYFSDNKRIDYSSSISLYNLVKRFNDLYLAFTDDYKELHKVKFGEDVILLDFFVYNDSLKKSKERGCSLYIEKPVGLEEYDSAVMYVKDVDNNISSYIVAGEDEDILGKYSYKKELKKGYGDMTSYLDFLEKYEVFFKSYRKFDDDVLFRNDFISITTKIIGNLNSEEVLFVVDLVTKDIVNYNNEISIVFKLGNDLQILYDISKLNLDSNKMNYKELIDRFVSNIYVNKKYFHPGFIVGNNNKSK
jgi:hypothetical protein